MLKTGLPATSAGHQLVQSAGAHAVWPNDGGGYGHVKPCHISITGANSIQVMESN